MRGSFYEANVRIRKEKIEKRVIKKERVLMQYLREFQGYVDVTVHNTHSSAAVVVGTGGASFCFMVSVG